MEENKKNKILAEVISLLKIAVVSFVAVYLVTTFIVRPIRVNGSSMYPTVYDEDIGVTNVIARTVGGLQRFDVVVVYVPQQNEYLIKRVIGLPGETIYYQDNKLYVDGKYVEEPFIDQEYMTTYMNDKNADFTNDFTPITIAEGEYFLMGDNRPYSSDSRYYGSFPGDQIIGKGALILFPFNHIRLK